MQEWLVLIEENLLILILLYSILGAGIKYIDAAFDEKIYNTQYALIMAPVLGFIWSITMMSGRISATILLAVVLGVLLKGKIDNKAHLIGLFSILILVFIFQIKPIIPPLIFLTAAAVLDEVGHDIISYNGNMLKTKKFVHQFIQYFFGRRYMMKIALIYLIILGFIIPEFFIAFMFFDEAYVIVGLFSEVKQRKNEVIVNPT